MTKRSNRLRLVVKESGKSAKQIINTFDDMETNNRGGSLKLPTDPVTISRHINAKRGFDIDMAVAYGKALDADPADICFEPVIKNVRGWIDPMASLDPYKVSWYSMTDQTDVISVRVPREFYADKFKLIEYKNPSSYRHGAILIYQRAKSSTSTNLKQFANPRNYGQFCLCGIPQKLNPKELEHVVGVPTPTANGNFIITDLEKGILKSNTKISVLHPIVSMITSAFFDNYNE